LGPLRAFFALSSVSGSKFFLPANVITVSHNISLRFPAQASSENSGAVLNWPKLNFIRIAGASLNYFEAILFLVLSKRSDVF